MVDLIYNFVNEVFMQNSTLPGADTLAVLITWSIILAMIFVLVRLVVWAFNLGRYPRNHLRR